jgi:hypothetical protein
MNDDLEYPLTSNELTLREENARLRDEIAELTSVIGAGAKMLAIGAELSNRLNQIAQIHRKSRLGTCIACNPASVDRQFPCRTRRLADRA